MALSYMVQGKILPAGSIKHEAETLAQGIGVLFSWKYDFKWRWYFLKKNQVLPTKTINFISNILNTNESPKNRLKQLIDVEKQIQNLMIKKGFKKEQVLEHWRF